MKSLVLGEGHSSIENSRSQPAIDLKKDNITRIPGKKYKSVVKVIESSSSLRDELSASMKLSANIHNVAPHVQGGFTQEIKFNVFDTFYLLRFSIEEYTELLQGKYSASAEAADLLLKNPEAFRNMYGDSFVDSITYGRELVAIIQLKQTSHSKSKKLNIDAQVKSPMIGEAAGSFSHALDKIESGQVANIYYFTSGSKNPQLELLNNIQDLRDLFNKLKSGEEADKGTKDDAGKKGNNSDASKDTSTNSDAKKTSDSTAQKSNGDTPEKKDSSKDKTDKTSSNGNDKRAKSSKTSTKKDANNAKSDKSVGAGAEKPADKNDKTKTSADDKKSTATTTKSDGKKSTADNDIQDVVQVDYTIQPYLKLMSHVNAQRLRDKTHAADTLLRKLSECHDRITAYQNSINYAFDNASLLQFNDENSNELHRAQAQLQIEDDRIKELASIITENPNIDDKIASQYLAIINKTIRLINNIDTRLIKFSESAFLLKDVTSYYNKRFESKDHSHRASHYFDLEVPPQTNSFIFRSSDSSKNLEYSVKRRRPFIGKKIYTRVQSGLYENDFIGKERKFFHSLYIADPKFTGNKGDDATFTASVYAKTSHNFSPISEIEYFKLLTEESKKKYTDQASSDAQLYRSLRNPSFIANFKGNKLAFKSNSNSGIDANGDSNSCLAIALGTTRRELYNTLLANLDNPNVRNSLAEEIMFQLKSTDYEPISLSDATKKKLIDLDKELSETEIRRSKLLAKYKKDIKDPNEEDLIKYYSSSSDENKDTIISELTQVRMDLFRVNTELDTFIRSREVLKEFLDNNVLPSKIRLGVNVAYAYGYAKNLNVRVWSHIAGNNQQLVLLDLGFQYINDRPTIDIFRAESQNHFENLSLTVPTTRSVQMFGLKPNNKNADARSQLVKSISDDRLQMSKGG